MSARAAVLSKLVWIVPFAVAVAAVHFVFDTSSPVSVTIWGTLAAASLFVLRSLNRWAYGALEISIGMLGLFESASAGRGAFSSDFSNDFDTFKWSVVALQTAAAVYVVVRGLDNLDKAWRERGSKWLQRLCE